MAEAAELSKRWFAQSVSTLLKNIPLKEEKIKLKL